MPDNLARFARLSAQAKTRRAIERDGRLNPGEDWARERAEELWRGRERKLALEAEGPPSGCHTCYQIAESYPWTGGFWDWFHGDPVNPVERPWRCWDGGGLKMTTFCTCECHGPDNQPMVVVAYA